MPTLVVTVLIGIYFQVTIAHAAQEASIEITYDEKLVYCSVDRVNISDQAILALNQGTPVTFIWEVSIGEARDYWLDKNIGDITIARQAIPDLISRKLIISDARHGISRTVNNIDDAIEFLSGLHHFPIIDRSLLTPGVRYNIDVNFYVQEGQFSENWWSGYMHFSEPIGQQEIVLP